jgi:hypothetical protein
VIDRDRLAGIPEIVVARTDDVARGIDDSIGYLASDAALASLARDIYWPKWHSPWWHMLLLWELGEAARIPARAVAAMVDALDRFPLRRFPIGDLPAGMHSQVDVLCHCAIGSVEQVLAACGVAVAAERPWIADWYVRYQMADGGLSCDEGAYLAAARTGECPSSMVGTIAPLEALLARGDGAPALDRAARLVLARELTHGSPTVHNADERDAAVSWPAPCFPRFYFYDTLRGLAAVVRWAEARDQALPALAIAHVVADLAARFPDGVVRVGRRAHDGKTTVVPPELAHRIPATSFPLLDAVSVLGAPSEALTRQWTATRAGLLRLLAAGRIP